MVETKDFSQKNTIKLYGKNIGVGKLLVRLSDGSDETLYINIVPDLSKVIELAAMLNKDIIVEQSHEKVILRGFVRDENEKIKIEEMLSKAGIDIKKDLINLLEVRKPNKMIRIKLYIAEINNDDGLEIKNNWTVGYKNYARNYGSGQEAVTGSQSFIPSLANSMDSAVTLTGGLTAGANLLGDRFNTGLTLNYLSSQGVATILDETELITLENKKATFHAGGNFYVRTQTTTDKGVPSTELKQIDYGLKLEAQVNSIINDEFVNLTITTKQDKVDWVNKVDDIPGFSTQSIDTNVIIKDKSTIVLGGLVNQNDAKNYWKIPFLGDIPVLGALFRSKSFQNGKSELVFFIVPEIVDPSLSGEGQRLVLIKEKINTLNSRSDKSQTNNKDLVKQEEKQSIVSPNETLDTISPKIEQEESEDQ